MFTGHHADARSVRRFLDVGRRLLPELTPAAFELDRIDVPGAARLGRPRPHGQPQGARHVVDVVPRAHYEELTGCGHCPQLEAPDEFCDLLLAFVD